MALVLVCAVCCAVNCDCAVLCVVLPCLVILSLLFRRRFFQLWSNAVLDALWLETFRRLDCRCRERTQASVPQRDLLGRGHLSADNTPSEEA